MRSIANVLNSTMPTPIIYSEFQYYDLTGAEINFSVLNTYVRTNCFLLD